MRPLITARVDENTYQKIFEAVLRCILSWDEETMKSQVLSQYGKEKKRVDIVLKGDGFGIVIEMKKPGEKLDDDAEGQLMSYMRILSHKCGLLVGDQIKAFYDENGITSKVRSFGFDPANLNGMALFEILDRTACSGERFREFVFGRQDIDGETNDTSKELKGSDTSTSNPPGFDFGNLITTYHNMEGIKFRAEGKEGDAGRIGWYYKHINIPDWPKERIFYAFLAERAGKKDVEVMFHIEGAGYDNVDRFIREKYEGKHIKLGNTEYEIEYKAAKHGRLVVSVPCGDGYENMARCMIDLITLTKDEISGALNGRT
jgi:hypothetical protein